jgi:nickel transport system ATP-binding protein
LLTINRVGKSYKKGGLFSPEKIKVIKDVSFECQAGECVGIIGESGSGKSTLGRLLLGIERPDHGYILFDGQDAADKKTRKKGYISAVFQDYKSSINPFFTVEKAIKEPLKLHGAAAEEITRKVDTLLREVGLDESYLDKYPHELSGGEVQRVCIARAISTEPKCILLDEAVSSLDASIQTQVLDLLKSLKEIHNMSYIFITHDIQAAAYICDRLIIFKDGQVEEVIDTPQLGNVQSPYARKLLRAMIIF